MWEISEELPESEHHTVYPVRVEADGNWYSLIYHESTEPTSDLVVLLPGLTDDSLHTPGGIVSELDAPPVNFLTLKYQSPFSPALYAEVIRKAISVTGNHRVVLEGYSLGGVVLSEFLTKLSLEGNEEFEVLAAIFRSSIIEQDAYMKRTLRLLYRVPWGLPFREGIFTRGYPWAVRVYPRTDMTRQLAERLVDVRLVAQELRSVPRRTDLEIPLSVKIFFIGLDEDRVINNVHIIDRLNLGESPGAIRMLTSSPTGTRHFPADDRELFRAQAELIRSGFGAIGRET